MSKQTFNIATAQAWFSLVRAELAANKEMLNELDSAVGDGDHGHTVARAFAAAETAVIAPHADLGTLFDAAAAALAESSGGAIGPLLASLFAEGGLVFKGMSEGETAVITQFFAGGLAAIQAVGGAKPGQKTMLDALAPAVETLQTHAQNNLTTALTAAAAAAEKGAIATRGMVAAHGRAHFLGDRSRGYQDAGATSMALMFAALLDAVNGKTAPPAVPSTKTATSLPPGKLINHPDTMIAEELEGLALAFPRLVKLAQPDILIRAVPKAAGKVGVAIGHGGGHTPSMGGFVGRGLLDADVYGPVFTCAPGVRIAEAIKLADRGAGVVLLVSNHAGDVLNARLAARRAEQEGHQVEMVLLGDDIATAPREQFMERRGLGGLLFALKMGGAAAEAGANLAEVAQLMRKANERTATLMVSVRPPTHPATGQPLFVLEPGQIEVGSGVHGEAGIYRGEQLPADALIDMMLEKLVSDLESLHNGRVVTFLNGAGGTSLLELHILQRRVHQVLTGQNIEIADSVIGSYFTTQEMGGFSLSLCAIDDELYQQWDTAAAGPYFRWPNN